MMDNQSMKSCHWKRKLRRWFFNTPYRSSDRAYEASKHLQPHSPFFTQLKSFSPAAEDSSRARAAFRTTTSSKSRYVICCSLLEHRFSLFILKIQRYSSFFSAKPFRSFPTKRCKLYPPYTNDYPTKNCSDTLPHKFVDDSIPQKISPESCPNYYMNDKAGNQKIGISALPKNEFKGDSASARLNNLKKMNRKLAWIEATLNEFDFRKKCCSKQIFSFQTEEKLIEKSLNCELTVSHYSPAAYESISLVPRSVTRTLCRFESELASRSSILVYNDFDLAKRQAFVSIQYVGFFFLLPFSLQVALKRWFLEPWIKSWWNILQIQVFLNPLQEEKALRQLREAEALLWLNNVIGNFADTQLQNFDADTCSETVRLTTVYNELNIQLLLQVTTNTLSVVTSVFLLLVGRKRLAVSNSRIQESFYSLSDTMKAFLILLLTDLCVGFHSPHGWEIIVGSLLEHFGLIPDKYVIPCFVSTFPVILDTVFKYWIFRHLNRTSPSIVATYHTMSE
uniref:Potassium/proton antiporter CemA n=1 Tax=Llavea cordifolia TaxID=40966 RepID=A0A3G5CUH8_9MONI|nr:chloroplast envelope membrane protein [Llavea cordifolia]AYW16346.1 chloroplast envelope membrane protein [Llavea cordifolia]